MGWMWSSSASPSKGPEASEQTKSASAAKQAESEYSDPEIAKFMAQLQAEFGGNNKSTSQASPEPETKSTPPPPTSSQSSSSSWTRSLWGFSSKPSSEPTPTPSSILTKSTPSTTAITPERLDPISESLLPSTMSCRQAFDNAFHCNSLGGQWTSVYREGTVRSCSEHWEDFWFCMRTRTYPSPQKEDAIKAHYRAKEWAKYHAPGRASSADVWEPRSEKVERDTAFRERMEMPDVSDEEWRRMEIERRRRVQEQESRRV